MTDIAIVPVAGIRHPPKCHAALDGIFDLGALDRNTGIGQRLALHLNGVTVAVRLLVVSKLHLEGRTLVFFHIESDSGSLALDGEASVEQSGRQREVCRTLAVAVCRYLLLADDLVVGVAQRQGELFTADGRILRCRHFLPCDSCNMNGLTWAVDAAVGKKRGLLHVILSLVVAVVAVVVDLRTAVVG